MFHGVTVVICIIELSNGHWIEETDGDSLS